MTTDEAWDGPLTDKERTMIDSAWERHKAAAPVLNPLIDTSIDALLDLHRIQVEGTADTEAAAQQVASARQHLVREILRSEFEIRSAAEARADDAERRGWIAGRDAVVQLALQTEEVPDDEAGTVTVDKWDWDSDFFDAVEALTPPQEISTNG